jgi:hypothetical protein
MSKRVEAVFSEALDIDPSQISDSLTYNSIKEWDSAAHMRLIAALEETYDIMIETDHGKLPRPTRRLWPSTFRARRRDSLPALIYPGKHVRTGRQPPQPLLLRHRYHMCYTADTVAAASWAGLRVIQKPTVLFGGRHVSFHVLSGSSRL